LAFYGESYERITIVPKAQVTAEEFKSTNFKEIKKKARELAVDENYGYGHAILFLIYKGLDINNIKACLSDKNWIDTTLANIKGKAIKPSNEEAFVAIDIARSKMMTTDNNNSPVPVLDPDGYRNGLLILQRLGVFTGVKENSTKFVENSDLVTPVVINLGLVEVAQKNADPRYLDPKRQYFITQKFGGKFTTLVKTAYLKFK